MTSIRKVLRQARRELTVLEQVGEFVVLPTLCCLLLAVLTFAQAMIDG